MAQHSIGVGLIGCGDIAPAHAGALEKTTGAKLAGCMDVVESSAKSLGEQYHVPWTTSVGELLANPAVELVTIATPAFTHLPLTETAAAAGKHVLCEKPLASQLSDADAMIAACKTAGVSLSTCFPLRYAAGVIWLKDLIASGALGEIIEIRLHGLGAKAESYWTGGFSGRTQTNWRKSRQQSGGGVFITNMIHHLDLSRAVTGLEVIRAYGETGTFATEVEVEDLGLASLRYSNGAIGLVEAGSCVVGGGLERDIGFLGTRGQARLAFGGGAGGEVYLSEAAGELPAGQWIQQQFEGNAHVGFYEDLAAALSTGRTPPVTGEDGRAGLEIVVAIYRSAELHQAVSLPLKGG